MRRALLTAHRILFVLLVSLTLYKALEPATAPMGGVSDKIWHFLAFYVLSLSAASAAPRVHLGYIAAAAIGFGIFIEAVQAVPALGRTPSVLDVVADLAGVFAALAPALVVHWRDRSKAQPQKTCEQTATSEPQPRTNCGRSLGMSWLACVRQLR